MQRVHEKLACQAWFEARGLIQRDEQVLLNFFADVLDLLQVHQLGKFGYLDSLFLVLCIDLGHQLCDSLTVFLIANQTLLLQFPHLLVHLP